MTFSWPTREEAQAALGVPGELLPISAGCEDLLAVVRGSAPALLRVRSGWVAISRAGRWRVRIVTPQGPRALGVEALRRAIEAHLLRPEEAQAALALLPERLAHNQAVRDAFVSRWASGQLFEVGFLVRPPSADLRARSHTEGRLLHHAAGMAAVQIARLGILVGTWWIVGKGALSGQLGTSGFLVWVSVLLTGLPLRTLQSTLQAELGLELGLLLQQRLFAGVLAIHPDEVRQDGIGSVLGRVYEGRNWQRHVVTGLVGAGVALTELGLAALVLGAGAASGLLGLLMAWTVLVLLGTAYAGYRAESSLTRCRLEMTARLVEAMAGHRTRMIQEPESQRHLEEDQELMAYTSLAQRRDQLISAISPLSTHGWRLLALLALASPVVAGAPAGRLALSVGGILMGEAALASVLSVVAAGVGGAVAWREIEHLYRAASTLPPEAEPPEVAPATLRLHRVGFRYPDSARPIVADLDGKVGPGDRILLSGPSGSGKSTLAALLAGLRRPTEGTLLLDGLDLASTGTRAWRRRVVYVPQFHLNHVVTETLAFNVLMGEGWPPTPADLERAREVCLDLGLGPLLERMPGALSQVVGDGGWQLSHGERARLFLARAVLQRPAVLVVDESFGAMDPITLDQVLGCLERRSPSLLVIHQ
jgi:ATP-binding cassette subfamily B protein